MRGKAFGLVTSAQQFGGVIGPLLGGFLGGYMLTRHILVITGIILLLAGSYTYFTKVKKDCGSLRNGLKTYIMKL